MWIGGQRISPCLPPGGSVASGRGVMKARKGAGRGWKSCSPGFRGRCMRGWHLQVASFGEVGLGAGRWVWAEASLSLRTGHVP